MFVNFIITNTTKVLKKKLIYHIKKKFHLQYINIKKIKKIY